MFLEQVLKAVGLEDPFIKLVMFCVSTTTLSVMWNGGANTDALRPRRGLRQGDPLSLRTYSYYAWKFLEGEFSKLVIKGSGGELNLLGAVQ